MKDFISQEIELGDILVHIEGTKLRSKVQISISKGSATKGGKIRVFELWGNGNWLDSNYSENYVIKVSYETLSEMVHKFNGIAMCPRELEDDLSYQTDFVITKSIEVKNL